MEQEARNKENAADPHSFDYAFVPNTARIAVYEDLKMPPQIIEIQPAPTTDYIEKLASSINNEKLKLGGKIPYSAIREVSENFIHAQFSEVVVSILDGGNTIRFCDQGPGIENKDKVTLPGYTSAIEPMKHYIRGVGSGLPLVKEYLDYSGGHITIEDNIRAGSVVTISLVKEDEKTSEAPQDLYAQTPHTTNQAASSRESHIPIPPLNERELQALKYFESEESLGVSEVATFMELANSSTYNLLKRMEEYGLIETSFKKKRTITKYGREVYQQLNKMN